MWCGGDTPLHAACRGHSEIVQVLLQAGAKTDVRNSNGSTPLMEAVCNGDTDSVRLLVAAGADVNCSCDYGKTPLIKAVELNQVEIVNIFIENNVDLERADYENRTALHAACYVGCDLVKRLLSAGSDIEASNYLSYTPFFLAFKRSDIEMMKILIEARANVNCINYKMKTPLFKAAEKADITMIKFLIENGAELSALLWAVRDKNEAIVDTFIAAECDVNYAGADKCTPLVFAVVNQNINLVTKLIQNNAKVNVLTHYPKLPPLISPETVSSPRVDEVLKKITLKCREENRLLNIAIQMSSLEVIETLLQAGADVNAVDEHGRSPLHIASMCGNLELVMKLLELCAEINTVDKFGNSPLFISILYKHKELSNFLLSSGAGVNLVCDSLCSSLYIAVLYDDTEQVRKLTQHGAVIQKRGESELLAALKNRNLEVAIQVLELGADPNVTDGDGQPALLLAFKLMHSLIYQKKTGKVFKTDSESLDNALSCSDPTYSIGKSDTILKEQCSDSNTVLMNEKYAVENLCQSEEIVQEHNLDEERLEKVSCYSSSMPRKLSFNTTSMMPHTFLFCDDEKLNSEIRTLIMSFLAHNVGVLARDKEGNSCLHLATLFCSSDILELLIASVEDVDMQNQVGETPLMKACQCGNVDGAKCLIKNGANVAIRDKNQDTALHHSVRNCKKRFDLVDKELLSSTEENSTTDNFHLNQINQKLVNLNEENDLNLSGGLHTDIVETLLEAGAKTDVYNCYKLTPLLEAVCNGDTDSVRLLVAARADVNCSCDYGKTPLIQAVELNQVEIIRILIENDVTLDAKDDDLNTALHAACSKGYDLVKLLLEAGAKTEMYNKNKLTPFNVAFKRSDVEMMKILIKSGADVNFRENNYENPLLQAAKNSDVKMSQVLIELGADVNAVDVGKWSSLLWAVKNNNEDIADALIDSKCDVNYAGADKCTPLVFAVVNQNINLVTKLIQNNAKVNVLTHYPELPPLISLATVSSPRFDEVLKKITLKCQEENTLLNIAIQMSSPEVIETLLQAGADVNSVDEHGRSPLHIASMYGNLELVMKLLELSAEINTVDKFGNSPVFISILYKHKKLSNFLLSSGADVNLVCDSLCSSLYIAVLYDDTEQVRQLIQHGAVIEKRGESELLAALKNRNLEVAIQVLELGADPNVTDGDGQPALLLAFQLMHSLIYQNRTGKEFETNRFFSYYTLPYPEQDNYDLYQALDLDISKQVNSVFNYMGNSDEFIYQTSQKYFHLPCLEDERFEIVSFFVPDRPDKQFLEKRNVKPEKFVFSDDEKLNSETKSLIMSFLIHNVDVLARDKEGNSCLHLATLFCSSDILELIVVSLGDVDVQNQLGETPLMKACQCGNFEGAKCLIKNGANVSIRDKNQDTALHHNARNDTESLDLFILLSSSVPKLYTFDAEAKKRTCSSINKVDSQGDDESSDASLIPLKLLEAKNIKGESVCHVACRRGHYKIVDFFLKNNCECSLPNLMGETPLMVALKHKNEPITKLLIDCANFIQTSDEEGQTALHMAAGLSFIEVSFNLVKIGANVDAQNNQGETPLFLASDFRIADCLIKAKCNLNVQNKNGETALHFNIKCGNKQVAHLLIESGADLDLTTSEGSTPLMYALRARNFKTAKYLVEHGANVNIQDCKGRSPFTYSILRNLGLNDHRYDKRFEGIYKYLVEHGASIDIRDVKGQTLCTLAVNEGRFECLYELVSSGADLNMVDNEGKSPLVLTLLKQGRDTLDHIENLLQLGANPCLDEQYTHLLHNLPLPYCSDYSAYTGHNMITRDLMHSFQFFLINKAVPCHSTNIYNSCKGSNLFCTMCFYPFSFARYIFANCFLFKSDICALRNDFKRFTGMYENCPETKDFQTVMQEPWPLVKLAFIEVSTLLGTGPMREEKLKQTKLPPELQTALMFQEPISRLPVEDWSKIPICFDPVKYETLPCPRPLLNYWPVGDRLVT